MKKLIFLIILAGIAVKLKAQQKLVTKPLGKFSLPDLNSSLDTTAPKLSIKPKTNLSLLVFPAQKQQNISSNIMIASLDRMPIVKPVGKWNMPVVKPDGNVKYNMPIKRLPAIVKADTSTQKLQP